MVFPSVLAAEKVISTLHYRPLVETGQTARAGVFQISATFSKGNPTSLNLLVIFPPLYFKFPHSGI